MFSDTNLVVAGIDTDAGKTVVSAILCHGLKADYWKPIQAGEPTDSDFIRATTQGGIRVLAEGYKLDHPQSPHAAADKEGITIKPERLTPPSNPSPLIIEGAGGLMVPLTHDYLYIDLFEKWKLPIVLVAKTYLGSINHTLLSIEALQKREIPIEGIIFNEGGYPESADIVLEMTGIHTIGNLPILANFEPETLQEVFNSWSFKQA